MITARAGGSLKRKGSGWHKFISKARQRFEARLGDTDLKLSLADNLRLIQMEKEIDDGEPAEIKVTRVDPVPTSRPRK